jgi:hypothetical protein
MFNFLNRDSKDNKLGKIDEPKNKKQDNILCSVNVELMYDGTISIRYFWPKFDENNLKHINSVSRDFGTMLYMINNGYLEKDMIETLSHTIDKDNDFDKEFTKGCLAQWATNINYEGPVISPTKVFGQYQK